MISARRTNTAIAIVVALLLIVTLVVALFGTPTSAPTINDVTATTALTSASTPDESDDANSDGNTTTSQLTRDADTSDSWFAHTFAVEQFDFPMTELDCNEMKQYFTMELCVVAQTARGDFMVTATEGFWDAQTTTDDPVDISLNFMVYVHTSENGPARAMSVLDGTVSAPYGSASSQVQTSTFTIAGNDVVVLEWSSADDETRNAGRAWSAVQVLAVGPGGLPEVVATYGGTNIAYASDASSLVITSERFGPPSRNQETEPWLTVLRLSPSQTSRWQETVSSQSASQFNASTLEKPSEESTYEFPRRRVTSGTIN